MANNKPLTAKERIMTATENRPAFHGDLTQRQAELRNVLTGGGRLRSTIRGWETLGGHKLREDTREAIAEPGDLDRIMVQGKYLIYDLIVQPKSWHSGRGGCVQESLRLVPQQNFAQLNFNRCAGDRETRSHCIGASAKRPKDRRLRHDRPV